MNDGQPKQTLFRTFKVPDLIIPRAKAELEDERADGRQRHINIRSQVDYFERKRKLGLKRANKKTAK